MSKSTCEYEGLRFCKKREAYPLQLTYTWGLKIAAYTAVLHIRFLLFWRASRRGESHPVREDARRDVCAYLRIGPHALLVLLYLSSTEAGSGSCRAPGFAPFSFTVCTPRINHVQYCTADLGALYDMRIRRPSFLREARSLPVVPLLREAYRGNLHMGCLLQPTGTTHTLLASGASRRGGEATLSIKRRRELCRGASVCGAQGACPRLRSILCHT